MFPALGDVHVVNVQPQCIVLANADGSKSQRMHKLSGFRILRENDLLSQDLGGQETMDLHGSPFNVADAGQLKLFGQIPEQFVIHGVIDALEAVDNGFETLHRCVVRIIESVRPAIQSSEIFCSGIFHVHER